jgi:hypothetical protein
MTQHEIDRAWELVNRYGPPNSWTAANGTLAASLGRALELIERLQYRIAILEERSTPYDQRG